MFDKPLCFVDIETTGSSFSYDKVIELAVIRVEKNKVVSIFHSLFNPGVRVDPFIINLTGINPRELEDAPQFFAKTKEIAEILKDAIFVAHNSRFDYNFLKKEFRRLEKKFRYPQLCTVKLSRKLFPDWGHYNLDAVMENMEIVCRDRHRAMGDASVLWELYKKMKKQFPKKLIKKHADEIMKHPSFPLAIPYEILDNLPEEPGVYIFYGDDRTPLYIGKSVNIHDRVMDHLSNTAFGTDQKMAMLAKNIEYIETAGELSALLLESAMIKDLKPLYNKKDRYARKLIGLKKIKDKKGYLTVKSCEITEITIEDLTDIVGVFKSERQMKNFLSDAVDNHKLCARILGTEKLGKNCFNFRLSKCLGACSGLEKPVRYNIRFIEAFYQNSIKNWPFRGAIMIHEKEEIEENHLFDKWCYLGSMTKNGFEKKEYRFDYDTYRIVSRYVLNRKNWGNIKEINAEKMIENEGFV